MVRTVFDAVEAIHPRRTVLLLVEQSAAKALSVTSRCYLMTTGEVVHKGRSEALQDDPQVQDIYLGRQAPHT
jgi:branched-chain amino acid transport system ATP-binding protein